MIFVTGMWATYDMGAKFSKGGQEGEPPPNLRQEHYFQTKYFYFDWLIWQIEKTIVSCCIKKYRICMLINLIL
jgi:hypothetical protein